MQLKKIKKLFMHQASNCSKGIRSKLNCLQIFVKTFGSKSFFGHKSFKPIKSSSMTTNIQEASLTELDKMKEAIDNLETTMKKVRTASHIRYMIYQIWITLHYGPYHGGHEIGLKSNEIKFC